MEDVSDETEDDISFLVSYFFSFLHIVDPNKKVDMGNYDVAAACILGFVGGLSADKKGNHKLDRAMKNNDVTVHRMLNHISLLSVNAKERKH